MIDHVKSPEFRKALCRLHGGFKDATHAQMSDLYKRLPAEERRRIHRLQGQFTEEENDAPSGEPERDVPGGSEK